MIRSGAVVFRNERLYTAAEHTPVTAESVRVRFPGAWPHSLIGNDRPIRRRGKNTGGACVAVLHEYLPHFNAQRPYQRPASLSTPSVLINAQRPYQRPASLSTPSVLINAQRPY